jgi:3-isopropylmalate/(R)-2-methylmalate dehydratase small subunit
MEKFTVLNGLVAPLDRANVDTDQIIPKQFLGSIKRTGFAKGCFADWRLEPDFVLNQPRYENAKILLARRNFGCGSSREHAPWALRDIGFEAIIAPSYGDIFFNNCCKTGILPVVLPDLEVDELFRAALSMTGLRLVIDLDSQTVATSERKLNFDIDPFRKYCMLNGLDEISLTLRHAEKIRIFETQVRTRSPWYF